MEKSGNFFSVKERVMSSNWKWYTRAVRGKTSKVWQNIKTWVLTLVHKHSDIMSHYLLKHPRYWWQWLWWEVELSDLCSPTCLRLPAAWSEPQNVLTGASTNTNTLSDSWQILPDGTTALPLLHRPLCHRLQSLSKTKAFSCLCFLFGNSLL